MGIILKYFFKNIQEKKLRTALILLAIILSGALFFATGTISSTMVKMYGERFKQYWGSAQITMRANQDQRAWAFYPGVMDEFKEDLEYSVGNFQVSGSFRGEAGDETFQLMGFKLDELQQMNPIQIIEESGLYPFEGNKIILPDFIASKHNLKAGDFMDMKIWDGRHKFKVAAIAEAAGFLMDDGENRSCIVPRNTLGGYMNARGKVSNLFLKLKDSYEGSVKEFIEKASAKIKRFRFRPTVSPQQIEQWTMNMVIPFRIMIVLVLAISVFIIFTSFQVITTERLPVIGTFRSIGASRKMTDMILFGESLLYGLLGILPAIGLGYLVALVMISMINSGESFLAGEGLYLVIPPGLEIQAALLAVFLSVISAAIPVIRISKKSIKDIVLNSVSTYKKKGIMKYMSGGIFILISVTVPYLFSGPLAMLLDVICLIFLMAGIISFNPLFINAFVLLFERIYLYFFGNIGILAAKNLKENKSILNNLGLLAISISGIFMIFTISESVTISLGSNFRDARYEVEFYMGGLNRNTEFQVRATAGVKDVYGLNRTWIEIPELENESIMLYGIDINRFPSFWEIRTDGSRESLYRELEQGRNILLSNLLKNQYNLKTGQPLLLGFKAKDREYRIAGFFDSIMMNGSFGLIGDKFYRQDTGFKNYTALFVKTSVAPEEAAANLKKKFKRRYPWITTIEEKEAGWRQSYSGILNILQGFAIIALIIGSIGIINNFIISFMERRRSLALFRSVGMSKVQGIVMLLIESLSTGIIGAFVGVVIGITMFIIIDPLIDAADISVTLFYSPIIAFWVFLAGILLTLGASVAPSLKTKKLDIIEAIKYE